MKTSVSEADFEVMAAQADLPLSAEQRRTLYDAYGMLEAMITRVNTPMPVEVEPAHIFVSEVR